MDAKCATSGECQMMRLQNRLDVAEELGPEEASLLLDGGELPYALLKMALVAAISRMEVRTDELRKHLAELDRTRA